MLELYTKINTLPKRIAKNLIGILENGVEEKYLEGLSKSLQSSKNEKVYFLVFSILVEMFEDYDGEEFMKFISTIRAISMCKSPIKLTEHELKDYLNSVGTMQQYFSNDMTIEFLKEYHIDYEFAIENINFGHLYKNQSTDSVGIFFSKNYYKDIPIKCTHCGFEENSFTLRKDKIKPKNFDNTLYDMYIIWRMIGLENLDLEVGSNDTHLLYGSFKCTKCKKLISPIKANSYHFLSQHDYQPLTLEQIKKIENLLLGKFDLQQENFAQRLTLYGEYVANLYWDNFGYNCLEPYPVLLKISSTLQQVLGDELIRITAKTAAKVLSKYRGKDKALQAEVCFGTGMALGGISEKSLDEITNCVKFLEKSTKLYKAEFGEESFPVYLSKINYLVEKANLTLEDNDIDNMLEYYKFLETVQNFDKSSLAEIGHKVSQCIAVKDPVLAVKLEENFYKLLCDLIGENRVELTDNKIDLAILYSNAGEYNKALKLLDNCLKVLTKELGGKKVLTTILNGDLDRLKSQPSPKLIEFIAQTNGLMATVLIMMMNYKKAIDLNKDSLKLYELLPISYINDISAKQMGLAMCYLKLNDKQQALKYIKMVIKTYKDILKSNDFEDYLEETKQQLANANKLFKEIKLMKN